jgi:hypothetical protein
MTDLLTRIENNQPIEAQELYDFVVAAIVKQGRPSVGDNDRCLYRGPDGLKCAYGHVHPDSMYSENMENRDIQELSERYMLPKSLIRHAALLSSLQLCHDGPSSINDFIFIKEFCQNANAVAKKYNLKPYGENP